MQIKALWGLMLAVAVSGAVGCAQTHQTMRGQSPGGAESMGPIIGSAPAYGQYVHGEKARPHTHRDFKVYQGFRDNNFGYEGGFYAGPEGYYTERDRIYSADGMDGADCQQGGGHQGCRDFPYHYQTYQYNWPKNQVYPPDVLPAGMVQYPYYTFRGPTDFFMK